VHAIEHEEAHRHVHATGGEHSHIEPPAAASLMHDWNDHELALARHVYECLYYVGLFAAFLTAFYTFRAFALTFHGPERIPGQAEHHAHESPPVMVAPLVILAICSTFIGVFCIGDAGNWGENWLVDLMGRTPSLAAGLVDQTRGPAVFHGDVAGISSLVALAGIGVALFLYLGEPNEARSLQRLWNLEGVRGATDPIWVARLQRIPWIGAATRGLRKAGLGFIVSLFGFIIAIISLVISVPLVAATFLTPYRLSANKFYFDEISSALVVWPLRIIARMCAWFDRWVIDGLVDLTGYIPAAAGFVMRGLQVGLVQFYALAMVLGMLVLVAARLLWAA
jgi:NADH-quinone oxidoreductase subunit L